MSITSRVKSVLPASSRSLHAMYYELGQMHGEQGKMWGEVGESRYMLLDVLKRLDELNEHIDTVDTRMMTMLWELYRREDESLPEAKRRFLTNLSPASGDLRLYQLASAQLLFEFDAFCQEHNLTYWLVSGTLLGAVRHKGFIPWDDDLDVGMPRKDIERIVELCKDNDRYDVTIRYDYYVHCRQARFRFADSSIPCFIDLFYFDPVSSLSDKTFEARETERAMLEDDLSADEEIYTYWNEDNQFVDDYSDEATPIRDYFDAHIASLYERGIMTGSLNEAAGIIWGIDNVNSGVSHHTWYLIPIDAILPIGKLPFEGHEANVPNDYMRCLTDIFGDIYDLPYKIGSYFDHLTSELLHDRKTRESMELLAQKYEENAPL